MARKFRKYGQVDNIPVHLQNKPTYCDKYKKEEDRVKALIGIIHEGGVARVVATEERDVNVSKSVKLMMNKIKKTFHNNKTK